MKTLEVRPIRNGNQAVTKLDDGRGGTLTLRGPSWEGEFANTRPAPRSNACRGSPHSCIDALGVRCDPLWWDR